MWIYTVLSSCLILWHVTSLDEYKTKRRSKLFIYIKQMEICKRISEIFILKIYTLDYERREVILTNRFRTDGNERVTSEIFTLEIYILDFTNDEK